MLSLDLVLTGREFHNKIDDIIKLFVVDAFMHMYPHYLLFCTWCKTAVL